MSQPSECPHKIWEMETEVADGYCPICMRADNAALREENERLKANIDRAVREAVALVLNREEDDPLRRWDRPE